MHHYLIKTHSGHLLPILAYLLNHQKLPLSPHRTTENCPRSVFCLTLSTIVILCNFIKSYVVGGGWFLPPFPASLPLLCLIMRCCQTQTHNIIHSDAAYHFGKLRIIPVVHLPIATLTVPAAPATTVRTVPANMTLLTTTITCYTRHLAQNHRCRTTIIVVTIL